MLQLYTGEGKGKTTAALGLVLRATGAGKKIAWIAFDKGGEGHYSERKTIRERLPEVEYFVTGLDRIMADGQFRFSVLPQDMEEGKRGLEILERLLNEKRHGLIVLDEINSSAALGIVDAQKVADLLKQAPPEIEIILTGRNAPPEFLALADLVTEMKAHKHYFDAGIEAREGIDY
ncbi:MAG: cob(I)yrinic acid a,c-diamide adenosyltransferase [Patescibacteria group bacterium]